MTANNTQPTKNPKRHPPSFTDNRSKQNIIKQKSRSRQQIQKSYLQTLLYHSILSHLNETFELELPTTPLDLNYEAKDITTSEILAEDILSAAINLFASFTEFHTELTESSALECFINMTKEAFRNGIIETRELLDSKQLLEGELAWQVEEIEEQLYEELNKYCQSFGYYCDDESNLDSESELMGEYDDIWDDELLNKLRM
ncbi:DUF5610 domain-containing protein [Neptuniibacter marinus]|uniref:DUF5610 domain-containing protein n=1 Tax=Neptuniibacter marinus TaxID=1806670 RepID=UPI00082E3F6A|nr:DUF5610 domain-containing protein [Neptuniibacter marinus]